MEEKIYQRSQKKKKNNLKYDIPNIQEKYNRMVIPSVK